MSQMIQVTPLWVDGKPFHDSADGKLQIPSNRIVKVTSLVNGAGGQHVGVNSSLVVQKLYKSNIFNVYEVTETLAQLSTTVTTILSTSGPQGPIGPLGPPGIQGVQGPAGSNGAPGISGAAGLNGAQGVTGPVGPVGQAGQTGTAGQAGSAGAQGLQGITGTAGAQGSNGSQGVQGLIGPQGNNGAAGPAGVQGPQGSTGQAGHGLNNRQAWVSGTTYNSGDYVFSTASASTTVNSLWVSTFSVPYVSVSTPKTDTGNWSELPGLAGPIGPVGPQGSTGVQGIVGNTGSAGVQGSQGLAGIQGPIGNTGAIGVQGPTGPIGLTGPVGSQGTIGAQGPQGNQGIQGSQGPAGTTGPQGPSVYIDTLQSVTTRGNTTNTPLSINVFGTTPNSYGVLSISTPADVNSYISYSMTRANQVAWGIGINTSNQLFFGYGGTNSSSNGGSSQFMSIDNLGNVVIYGTLTVGGAIQSPRFYS